MLVYVALGGNIGDTNSIFLEVLKRIGEVEVSSFHRTSPVSSIRQSDFLNAVCRFTTEEAPLQLMERLEEIEKEFGKIPKGKEEPRTIDLDLLFYGNHNVKEGTLEIPHPRWKIRLFVLEPLRELTEKIAVGGQVWDIQDMIDAIKRNNDENCNC